MIIIALIAYFARKNTSGTTSNKNISQQEQVDQQTINENQFAEDEVRVAIADFAFNPNEIRIKMGETVTWTNEDNVVHTVTSDTNTFDSGNIAKNQSYSYTFNQTGTFSYHCTPHPNMKGTVMVEE